MRLSIGMKFAVKLVEKTNAMKELNAHLMVAPFPGCELEIFKSDAYWRCLARHATITAYKFVSLFILHSSIYTLHFKIFYY